MVLGRAAGDEAPVEVAPETLAGMLGPPSHRKAEVAARTGPPGVAPGLSLGTVAGGGVLFVEVRRMPGTGALTLTGGLGNVMQESARVALSWVRVNAVLQALDLHGRLFKCSYCGWPLERYRKYEDRDGYSHGAGAREHLRPYGRSRKN